MKNYIKQLLDNNELRSLERFFKEKMPNYMFEAYPLGEDCILLEVTEPFLGHRARDAYHIFSYDVQYAGNSFSTFIKKDLSSEQDKKIKKFYFKYMQLHYPNFRFDYIDDVNNKAQEYINSTLTD